MISFAYGYVLLLIPVLLFIILKKEKRSALDFSSVKLLKNRHKTYAIRYRMGRWLIALALTFLLIGLARPQLPKPNQPISQEGIDIALLLDASGSMQSVDFDPNRLEVAKDTLADFVDQRYADRLGLIVFGGSAYTKIPLTLDHQVLEESLKAVTTDSVNEEGTAIGMAISVGINRLKKSEAASKVMILLTDGDNNAGAINPETASRMAKELGIRIYTIGVGTDKTIIPVQILGQTQYQQVQGGLNEPLLKTIAENTGGEYYRAQDENSLEDIFKIIDGLERSKFEEHNFRQYQEFGYGCIGLGMILLLLGIYWDQYYYIQIP